MEDTHICPWRGLDLQFSRDERWVFVASTKMVVGVIPILGGSLARRVRHCRAGSRVSALGLRLHQEATNHSGGPDQPPTDLGHQGALTPLA